MKKIMISGLIILIFGPLTTVNGQNNPAIDKKIAIQFDELLTEIKKIDITKPDQVSKVAPVPSREKVFDSSLPLLATDLDKAKKEIEIRKNQFVVVRNKTAHPIDKDLLAIMAEMPEPIASLPDAKKAMNIRDEQIRYNIYIEKLKRIQEQLKDEIRKYALNAQDASQMRTVAEKNADKTMQDLKTNSLVQEAGGMEKLQQMTPEERAAWGKKMAEKVRNDPSAYTGIESDPRKAFSNKMMKDPNYAARFQHMNQQQQQEEYKAFMAENGFIDQETARSAQIKSTQNEALTRIAISQRTTEILNHRKQLAEIAGSAQQRTDNYFLSVNSQLNDQYAARVAALPIVEHGEAGKGKDTYPVDLAYNIIVYTVEVQNAQSNKDVWKVYLEALKVTIAEYNEFLSEFWGRDKETDKLMASQNQTPPAILAGACNDLIWLTEMAKSMTNTNASWQRNYDEKILHLYESIKN